MNEGKVTNRKVGEEETGTRGSSTKVYAVGWIEDSSFFFFLLSTPTKGWKKKKDNPQRPSFVQDESKKKQERWRWWVEDESKKKKRPNDRHAIPELISVRMHIVQPSVGRTFPLLLLWSRASKTGEIRSPKVKEESRFWYLSLVSGFFFLISPVFFLFDYVSSTIIDRLSPSSSTTFTSPKVTHESIIILDQRSDSCEWKLIEDGSRNRLTMRLTVDHSLLWFSFNQHRVRDKVMNVGRRPCQPFHRECFYVTGTPTYSLVFDQQRESYWLVTNLRLGFSLEYVDWSSTKVPVTYRNPHKRAFNLQPKVGPDFFIIDYATSGWKKSGLKPTVHEALHPTTASSLIFHSPSVTIHLVGLSLTFT